MPMQSWRGKDDDEIDVRERRMARWNRAMVVVVVVVVVAAVWVRVRSSNIFLFYACVLVQKR